MTLRALASQLLDALVDGLEPITGKLRSKQRLVVVEEADGFRFFAVDRGRTTELPADIYPDGKQSKQLKKAGRGAIELRLASERLISRTLQLPAAGREYLAPIIEHRLDRLTPWRPDKAMYGFAVTGEPAADGTMAVEFLATSGDIAGERLARLAALDLVPTAIGSAGEPIDAPLRIDLYRGTRDVGRQRLRRRAALALALAALLLVPGYAGSLWLALDADARLAALEQRLATKRNVLQVATGNSVSGDRDLRLIQAKRPETAAMLMIDRLATLLPDDTYLREMEIDGGKVRIAGYSANAPVLIPLLEGDDSLSEVRFSAPVTRDEQGRDGFDIVARWDARTPPPATDPDATPGAAGTDPFSTGALP